MEVSSCLCHFTPGERIAVTHSTEGWVHPRVGLYALEKRDTPEDTDFLGYGTVLYSEWLPASGSSRRIVGCWALKMKVEMWGTAHAVTWHYISEDPICSSSSSSTTLRTTNGIERSLLVLRLLRGLSHFWNQGL
jgi:hypothetical protein